MGWERRTEMSFGVLGRRGIVSLPATFRPSAIVPLSVGAGRPPEAAAATSHPAPRPARHPGSAGPRWRRGTRRRRRSPRGPARRGSRTARRRSPIRTRSTPPTRPRRARFRCPPLRHPPGEGCTSSSRRTISTGSSAGRASCWFISRRRGVPRVGSSSPNSWPAWTCIPASCLRRSTRTTFPRLHRAARSSTPPRSSSTAAAKSSTSTSARTRSSCGDRSRWRWRPSRRERRRVMPLGEGRGAHGASGCVLVGEDVEVAWWRGLEHWHAGIVANGCGKEEGR